MGIAMLVPDLIMYGMGVGVLAIPLHLFGIVAGIIIGRFTLRFDRAGYSGRQKMLLAASWVVVWAPTTAGFLMVFITLALSGMGGM